MKIGFLLFDYFPFGGLQRDCLKVAKQCADRGHEVSCYTRTWQGDRPDWLELHLLGKQGFTNIARNRSFIQKLGEAIPAAGLDGVVGFNRLPGLDVYFGSDPCYAAKVEAMKSFWYRWLPRYRHYQSLEKAVFDRDSKAHILLLLPKEIPDFQRFYRTGIDRFTVLPPGIPRIVKSGEERAATRQRVRSAWGWTDTERILLMVGSGFRTKGLDRIITGFASLPSALRSTTRLVVIGQNRATAFQLQARKGGVGDRVHFLGGRHDVPDFLEACDLYVHPAYSEAAGMVLLEALTHGLPVLTTANCGYASHIETSGGGVVIPMPFDQGMFNQTLQSMLTDLPHSSWGMKGLEYAAQEDLYSCHLKAAETIEKVLDRRR